MFSFIRSLTPIQYNTKKRAQVFLFAHIFYFTYKLKHLRIQLIQN